MLRITDIKDMPNRQFPIQWWTIPRRELPEEFQKSIPWGLIGPHEAQAQRNHSQSLTRLAERLGLSWCEAVAIIENRPWTRMTHTDAAARLQELTEEWNKRNDNTS